MIRPFLDASSGHLSPETWTWLDQQPAEGVLRDPAAEHAAQVAGGPTRRGWFVYGLEDLPEGLPTRPRDVLRHARAHGADYVLFDCDAQRIEGLPILHPDFRE